MKSYQKLLLSLSLLTFISCGSSGGGSSNLKPTVPPETSKLINSEITKNKNTMTETTTTNTRKVKPVVPKTQASKESTNKVENVELKTQEPKKEVPKEPIVIQISNLDETLSPKTLGTATFNGNININDEESIGAIANEGVNLINGEKSTITGNMNIGMKAQDKGIITNNGEIKAYATFGMFAEGESTLATNNNKIILSSINPQVSDEEAYDEGVNTDSKVAVGMYAENGGSIINAKKGSISGDMNIGMALSSGNLSKETKAINDGNIIFNSTTNNKDYIIGMYAMGEKSNAINNNNITFNGTNNKGIVISKNNKIGFINGIATGMNSADGANIINVKEGTISGDMNIGMSISDGISGRETKAINYGNISFNNTNNSKVSTDKIDRQSFAIKLDKGMSANGQRTKAINYGSISFNNSDSNEVEMYNNNGINIYIEKLNYGMYSENGGSITNGNGGTISGELTNGMYADGEGSSAINENSISLNGTIHREIDTDGDDKDIYYKKQSNGMFANGGSIINANGGTISGELTNGMSANGEGSGAINRGDINSKGSVFDDVYIENNKPFYSYEVSGIGMSAENGANIVNVEGANISGRLANGMSADGEKSSAINEGSITSDGYYYHDSNNPIDQKLKLKSQDITKDMLNYPGVGMEANNGASVTNDEKGIIQGNFEAGMLLGEDGRNIGRNNGKIISYGDNFNENFNFMGIRGYENSEIRNNGEIIMIDKTTKETDYTGIYSNGIVLNKGDIYGDFDKGIIVKYLESSINRIAAANNTGKITLTKNESIGMEAKNGAIAYNTGSIYLNGSNQVGMYATGEGSTIENDGHIYLSGTIDNNFRQTNENGETADLISGISICNGKDSKGNIGMKIEDGAKMINKGTIHFAQSE